MRLAPNPRHSWWLLTTLALLAFTLASPLHAPSVFATQHIELDLEIGFNGKFVSNHFTPVVVRVRHEGPAIEAQLVLWQHWKKPLESPRSISQQRDIQLGPNADQLITFYFPVSRYAPPGMADPMLHVEVWEEGKLVRQKSLVLSSDLESERIVLVLSDFGAQRTLPTEERVEYIEIEQLPEDWRGFDGVGRLYFGRARIDQLTHAQELAIEQWVAAGGELVVFSGENYHLQESPWLSGLIPFSVREVSDGLADGTMLALGDARGQILASENSLPLLVVDDYLRGRVYFSALDLMLPREIDNAVWLWLTPESRGLRDVRELGDDVLDEMVLAYPDKLIVGLAVLFYLILFGYFTLWILKQPTSRLRQSMLDVPNQKKQGGRILSVLVGLVLFFSIPAMAYLAQSQYRSHFYSAEIGILQGKTGVDWAWNRDWYSAITKRDTKINLSTSSASIVSPLDATDLGITLDGQDYQVDLANGTIPHWTKKHVFSERLLSLGIGITISQSGPNVRGVQIEVYNNTRSNLSEVALYHDGLYFPIGDLPAGESLNLSDGELVASQWPKLPGLEHMYDASEVAKSLLKQQPEVTRTLGQNPDDWFLLGWIDNEFFSVDRQEDRTSLKLVMIESTESDKP